jgi:prepilin-type N-terminal cleavage/methylation domain-containing protein
MKFTCKAYRIEKKTAAPAVCFLRGGFTMLELMVVIVIIGILSSLAYSSLIDVVFTNRAKETAQAMRTFVERSLAEAKRQNMVVTLKIDGSNMQATFKEDASDGSPKSKMQPLSDGFKKENPGLNGLGINIELNEVISQHVIGTSGIADSGAFMACGGRGYCGAVVKRSGKNSFEAWIKKGSNASWSQI